MQIELHQSVDADGSALNNKYDIERPIFLQPAWFTEFEKHILDSGKIPVILAGKENDSPCHFLPFFSETKTSLLKPKTLQSMTNYYSPYFDLVGRRVSQGDLQMFCTASAGLLKQYDQIVITPLLSEQADEIMTALERCGFRSFRFVQTQNWYHDNIESFEQFYSNCSKNLRSNTRRAKSKLDSSGEFRIEISCQEDLEQRLNDYFSVYEESWKHEESHPEFLCAVSRLAASNNQLRLGVVYHKNYPVAAQMWFVDSRTAYIFKLAYREKYSAQSVGNVLTMEMCRHTIEQDGVTTIDFLTGNDSYKARWMTKNRDLVGVIVTNPKRFKGLACCARERLAIVKKMFFQV
ncbi:hypothetical protein GCM10009092_37340 [Bowmanella denitrificans]|uniref:BioF2-like acetyltransferase domain-containing protein n=1 Tax=Bowmanella denitrificans TaxID=366582 RepID=A0ABN0XPH7_9ALTE